MKAQILTLFQNLQREDQFPGKGLVFTDVLTKEDKCGQSVVFSGTYKGALKVQLEFVDEQVGTAEVLRRIKDKIKVRGTRGGCLCVHAPRFARIHCYLCHIYSIHSH